MKKKLTVFLALIMIISAFAGCQSQDGQSAPPTEDIPYRTPTVDCAENYTSDKISPDWDSEKLGRICPNVYTDEYIEKSGKEHIYSEGFNNTGYIDYSLAQSLELSTFAAWGTILGFDFIQITNRYDEYYTYYTDYYFEVEESFRGQPMDDGNGVIRIRVSGGEGADMISENKGLNFIKGHRYLFFLENPFMGNGVYTEDQDYYTIVSVFKVCEKDNMRYVEEDGTNRYVPYYFSSYSYGGHTSDTIYYSDLVSYSRDYNELHPVKTTAERRQEYIDRVYETTGEALIEETLGYMDQYAQVIEDDWVDTQPPVEIEQSDLFDGKVSDEWDSEKYGRTRPMAFDEAYAQNAGKQYSKLPVIISNGYYFMLPQYYLRDSDLAVWGRIVGFDYVHTVNYLGEHVIYTDYYFDVYEAMRGEPALDDKGLIRIRVEGGETSEYVVKNNDFDFIKGHYYLFFLNRPFAGMGVETEDMDYYTLISVYEMGEHLSREQDSTHNTTYIVPGYFAHYGYFGYREGCMVSYYDLRELAQVYNTAVPVKDSKQERQEYVDFLNEQIEAGWEDAQAELDRIDTYAEIIEE